jgi:uncharacterized glyoxalase superfamily protein PhnB
MKNRSVPCDTVLPHIPYQNLPAALEWLTRVFGFMEHYRYGEPISGAQLYLGPACIMIGSRSQSGTDMGGIGRQKPFLTIFVDDVDAHYRRTKSAGTKITEDLNETAYGERQYAAEDLEGYRWLFAQHVRDADPAEWGAKVAR